SSGQDLVDPVDGSGEIGQGEGVHVEVPAENELLGLDEEVDGEPDPDAGDHGVVRRMDVRHGQSPAVELDLDGLAHAALPAAADPFEPLDLRVQDKRPFLPDLEAAVPEDR